MVILALIQGCTLGATAGLSPGPLMNYIISETLSKGLKRGLLLSFIPIISDGPIIFASLFLLETTGEISGFLQIIGYLGAIYLLFLSYKTRTEEHKLASNGTPKFTSIWEGVMVNYLNPHVYIFWLTIGGSLILTLANDSLQAAGIFIASFLLAITVTKMILAYTIHKSNVLITPSRHNMIMKILSIGLAVFAWLLIV